MTLNGYLITDFTLSALAHDGHDISNPLSFGFELFI